MQSFLPTHLIFSDIFFTQRIGDINVNYLLHLFCLVFLSSVLFALIMHLLKKSFSSYATCLVSNFTSTLLVENSSSLCQIKDIFFLDRFTDVIFHFPVCVCVTVCCLCVFLRNLSSIHTSKEAACLGLLPPSKAYNNRINKFYTIKIPFGSSSSFGKTTKVSFTYLHQI